MFKKILSTTVLSVSALAAMTANAAAPGVYVTGQIGYTDTNMASKTNVSDLAGNFIDVPKKAKDQNLSNNGLAGRLAVGYQFNQNFAVEAGYLQLGEEKLNLGLVHLKQIAQSGEGKLKLQQNVIDFAGKGILPIMNNMNVYGKLGVAYITSNILGTVESAGAPTATYNLNDTANVAQHKWAPEAAIGVSYDITPNVSLDASLTHIQPLGSNKPGNIDFAALGVGYNFG
jgi:opacity protein-like surface antigen